MISLKKKSYSHYNSKDETIKLFAFHMSLVNKCGSCMHVWENTPAFPSGRAGILEHVLLTIIPVSQTMQW
jgi:hypothetical protein